MTFWGSSGLRCIARSQTDASHAAERSSGREPAVQSKSVAWSPISADTHALCGGQVADERWRLRVRYADAAEAGIDAHMHVDRLPDRSGRAFDAACLEWAHRQHRLQDSGVAGAAASLIVTTAAPRKSLRRTLFVKLGSDPIYRLTVTGVPNARLRSSAALPACEASSR